MLKLSLNWAQIGAKRPKTWPQNKVKLDPNLGSHGPQVGPRSIPNRAQLGFQVGLQTTQEQAQPLVFLRGECAWFFPGRGCYKSQSKWDCQLWWEKDFKVLSYKTGSRRMEGRGGFFEVGFKWESESYNSTRGAAKCLFNKAKCGCLYTKSKKLEEKGGIKRGKPEGFTCDWRSNQGCLITLRHGFG